MVGTAPKATRRGVKKSRDGCARCKSQHLKCDEQRPSCGRCARLAVLCGYSKPLKWSTKHEHGSHADPQSARITAAETSQVVQDDSVPESPVLDFDWLNQTFHSPFPEYCAELREDIYRPDYANSDSEALSQRDQLDRSQIELALDPLNSTTQSQQLAAPETSRTHHQPMLRTLGALVRGRTPAIQKSVFHEPSELLSYYFKVVPQVYSMFDNHRNPFRSAVSNAFNHSLAVNLAAQSMAAACLIEIHPRFAVVGSRLRDEALEASRNEKDQIYNAMLAFIMSGPTGNWFQPNNLDLTTYRAVRAKLDELALIDAGNGLYTWFREALVLWDMLLAFAADPPAMPPSLKLRPAVQLPGTKYTVHPWNGVARETLEILGDVGRLVRGNRLRHINQAFITQDHILRMTHDLRQARDLEGRLLAVRHPAEDEIASTEDAVTPIWHVTTLAELQRYAGLIQLYHVFPDLLDNRLEVEDAAAGLFLTDHPDHQICRAGGIHERRHWLTSFAMEALSLLRTLPCESGTKDFQPFLLVAFASELVCEPEADAGDFPAAISTLDDAISKSFADVALTRKFTVDRLSSLLRIIPPKPIRICLDIVKETWRRIDDGQHEVYWLDVMIENGWETLLA